MKLQNKDESQQEDFLVVQWLRIHLQIQNTGSNLWSRKIPYAAGQLSLAPQLMDTGPTVHAAMKRSHLLVRSPLLSTTRESLVQQMEINTSKLINLKERKKES